LALSPVHTTKSSLSFHSFEIQSNVSCANKIGASHFCPGVPYFPDKMVGCCCFFFFSVNRSGNWWQADFTVAPSI
jgi:hypothetical protein